MGYMNRDARRALLRSMDVSEDLLAVDPHGCGCTECLIGEYIPSNRIDQKDVEKYQALIQMGVLSDHTDGWFMPFEPDDDYLVDQVYRALVDDGWLTRDRGLDELDLRMIAATAFNAIKDD